MSEHVIDLHTHTTYSDGSATPGELIRAAVTHGARAIAITDHDTVDGLAEGRTAASDAGVEFVNGIEISADYSPGTMHILGYYIDDQSEILRSTIERLKAARERRNPEIARRLQQLGYDITFEEVASVAGSTVVGRPHFAKVLLDKGHVSSIQDAFNRLLAKNAPAYVEKERLAPGDAVSLIHAAGGAAVLAHPYQLKLSSFDEAEQKLEELAKLGLDGVEAVYSRHTAEQRTEYCRVAEKYGLVVTGGSDFHGRYKPDIEIVKGLGELRVPYSLLERLRERALAHASNVSANKKECKTEPK